MPNCTFYGHRNCPQTVKKELTQTIESLICNYGVTKFYVGDKGNFDGMVISVLKELSVSYDFEYYIVLSTLPNREILHKDIEHILPEGFEKVPKRFGIDYRNKYMLKHSDFVVVYITQSISSGASKYYEMAQKQKKYVINIANITQKGLS